MSFLTLNGTTVHVRSNALQQKDNEHRLDRERMFDGTMRLTRGGVFRQWDVTTHLMTEADANTLLALVRSGNVLTASGDVVGSDVAVMPVPGGNNPVHIGGGQFRRQVTFTLHETGGPLPPDTSAVPYAFHRGGFGYLTGAWADHPIDITGLAAAGDGDTVSVWKDQSGNDRHLIAAMNNNFLNYDSRFVPVRDGDELHFGVNAFSGMSYATALAIGTTADSWWSDVSSGKREVLIACRAASSPPLADGQNALWGLGRSGGGSDGNPRFPKTDGHIYETAMSNHEQDLGNVAATTDLASLTVYDLAGWSGTVGLGSATFEARINNVLIYSNDESASSSFPYVDGGFRIGAPGSDYFLGWVRHVVSFTDVLTVAQRRSWYDFFRGAVADPPL